MRPARPLILLLACLGWPAAHAQAIYRCGDSYQQQPCAGGTQVAAPAPAPSAADRSQAAAAAARDARLAEAMEKDRLRREAQAGSALHVTPAAAPAAELEPHKWPDKAGTRKLDVFTASVPGSGSAKARSKAAAKSGNDKDTVIGKAGTKAKGEKAAKAAKPASAAGRS